MRTHRSLPSALCLLAMTLLFAGTLAADAIKLGQIVSARETDAEGSWLVNANAKNPRAKLTIAGKNYTSGVRTQVNTDIAIVPNGAIRFTALVGVDDATTNPALIPLSVDRTSSNETDDDIATASAPPRTGPVVVRAAIVVDGVIVWSNDTLRPGQPPVPVSIDITNAKEIHLLTEDIGHALTLAYVDWADAIFDYEGAAPEAVDPRALVAPSPNAPPAQILTPKPGPAPRITGARVFGARPGHPVLYTITATGDRPMRFTADNLPAGLTLDPTTGRITGTLPAPATHHITLRAQNALGTDTRTLRLVIGELISLTPALGWNSWNCWAGAVSQEKILRSARAMVTSGLANHGWSYINIDDAWQGARPAPAAALQPNKKFPDISALADAVHALGLKLGIYSTPWVVSYAGYQGGTANNPEGTWEFSADHSKNRGKAFHYIGKYSFATADANQWAAWNIDYLKYDWHPNLLPETKEMFDALRASGRDILLSLSNGTRIENIADLIPVANSWRTTGDIRDTWGCIMRLGFTQNRWRPHAGPGHWNDPDMLVVGCVGWGPNLHPTRLTPDEQYTHITLWCLLAAPLLIGCDLERLDDFTLNLLTNDEVLEVDQDPKGDQAARVFADGRRQAWMKTMEDGSRAIGLFNLSKTPDTITVTWEQLGLPAKRPQRIRDLWRQRDLPDAEVNATGLSFTIPAHGCCLLRVW